MSVFIPRYTAEKDEEEEDEWPWWPHEHLYYVVGQRGGINIRSEAARKKNITALCRRRRIAEHDELVVKHKHLLSAGESSQVAPCTYSVGAAEPAAYKSGHSVVAASLDQASSTIDVKAATTTNTTRTLQCLSAATSAGLSCALFNWLDCLRVRWQVAGSYATAESNVVTYGMTIIRNEGLVAGLWKPGLGCNVIGMAMSSAFRFGWYADVRDQLVLATKSSHSSDLDCCGGEEKGAGHMVLAGLITGSVGYMAVTPFHLLKTMIQADKGGSATSPLIARVDALRQGSTVGCGSSRVVGFWDGVHKLLREGGWSSLWRGAVPLGARGALFTAGQMLGYDGFKTLAKGRWDVTDSPALHVASSIAASFGASFMSAPADMIMARYMASRAGPNGAPPPSLCRCIKDIYRTRNAGIFGFWRGWPLFFVRLVPVMLTFSTAYEQCRYHLGLGYFS